MTIELDTRDLAAQKVKLFERQFGSEYRLLAYHAALPLVLTPELLHYLRTEFLLDNREILWEAEADLLLSDLCAQVGYELYAMDGDVRSYLLQEMSDDPRIPKDRMSKVAQVLISYVAYLSRVNPGRQQELQAQRWAAMIYLGDSECDRVVQEITTAFTKSSARGNSNAVKAEFARLARITEKLVQKLGDNHPLIKFAQDLNRSLKDSSINIRREYVIGDRHVNIPWIDPRNIPDFYDELLRRQFDNIEEKIANDFTERGYELKFRLLPVEIDELNIIDEVSSIEVITVNISDIIKFLSGDNHTANFEISVEIIFSVEFRELDQNDYTSRIYNDIESPRMNRLIPNQSITATVNVDTILSNDNNPEMEIESLDLIIDEPILVSSQEIVFPQYNDLKDENSDIEWQEIEFEVVTIEFYEYPPLVPFDFEVATLIVGETNIVQRTLRRSGIKIERTPGKAYQFIELLNDSRSESLSQHVVLEMVQIPAGEFVMGASKEEFGSKDFERPQHLVNVPEFYLGKYPITQEQWRFGTSLPKIALELSPEPSYYKGKNLPVGCVSWYDAIEFCARLSHYAKREYRLPSEAEWEYACRAGTTTPFYFGETITTDLANYNGKDPYGRGSKGTESDKPTAVNKFPPNAFGLYDLHGNIWEWCQDHNCGDYTKAPINGSAWLIDTAVMDAQRIVRGGNFFFLAHQCRSASRYGLYSNYRDFTTGFRIACSAGSTR